MKIKKRKIDFILEDNKYDRLVFRFYPRQSSCHSHNDEPPKSWDEVYKIYYNYSIIEQYKEEGDIIESNILFNSNCDECSVIGNISFRIDKIVKGDKVYKFTHNGEKYVVDLFDKVYPTGMGVEWKITEAMKYDGITLYELQLFRWDCVGFRFALTKEKLKEFGEFLEYCNEYMLEHGDPI